MARSGVPTVNPPMDHGPQEPNGVLIPGILIGGILNSSAFQALMTALMPVSRTLMTVLNGPNHGLYGPHEESAWPKDRGQRVVS